MLDISVVSGTYNRLSLLKRMVGSVRRSVGQLKYEIILVDGGSTDGTIEWAATQDDVVLIEQGELIGAIKAYNAGFAKAQGRYVVVGNDDIVYEGKAILAAAGRLDRQPSIAVIAFGHKYRRRGNPDQPKWQGAYGYLYGQCCAVRRELGDMAGWWGNDGMRTYGGDARLSLRLWEMGYRTVRDGRCVVVDDEHNDELRKINSDSPRVGGKTHPDLVAFSKTWKSRLPPSSQWIPAPVCRICRLAASGRLRTMRFKSTMRGMTRMRTAMIDAWAKYGPTHQVNQSVVANKRSAEYFQTWALQQVGKFKPDLLLLQAQRPNNVLPDTVREMRRRWPQMYIINWDGDTHYPMTQFHWNIAAACHLQLTVSPSLFPEYLKHGIYNIGYWPIGIEREYLEQRRPQRLMGADVIFTGALYGIGTFPEAEVRRDAVVRLAKSGLKFDLYGTGWNHVGLKAKYSGEQHEFNARLYSRARLALSISQSSDLWGYTSDRLYNITATGCPALVQRFAGMEEHGYVDGETCIAWSTLDEMMDKARYYLKHRTEREAIGEAGREMTHARHTWERRVEALWQILPTLG